jgi:1-acyl-sn-glycerol-3-phosphate acyltransferase
VLRVWGWRFTGELPDCPKAVVIVAPHTSNWDFVLGIAGMFAVGVRVSWLGKHTIFRGPFGAVMRWLGGIAVDRRSSAGVVEQTVARFEASDRLILGMSPEGTRSRVDRWRTGFYYIASGAGVPIVPVSFCYQTRTIRFGEPILASGDREADFRALEEFFNRVTGRR